MPYSVYADIAKNRLVLGLEGFLSLEEITKSTDETIAAAKKMKPGYDVITDISKYITGTPEVAKEIERAQAFFVASGVHRGVRIVAKVIPGMQFKISAKEAGYESINVATMEEAERYLDGK
mgnify:CR=1 FL=1